MINLRSKDNQQTGFSLIELLVVVAMSGMIFMSLSSVMGEMFSANENIKSKTNLYQEANFTMDKIVTLLARSGTTSLNEDNYDPASQVEISIAMDPLLDMDKDGTPDAVVEMHLEWKGGLLVLDTGELTFDVTGDGEVKNDEDEFEFFISDLIKEFTFSISTPDGSDYELAEIGLLLSDNVDSVSLSTKVRLGGQL